MIGQGFTRGVAAPPSKLFGKLLKGSVPKKSSAEVRAAIEAENKARAPIGYKPAPPPKSRGRVLPRDPAFEDWLRRHPGVDNIPANWRTDTSDRSNVPKKTRTAPLPDVFSSKLPAVELFPGVVAAQPIRPATHDELAPAPMFDELHDLLSIFGIESPGAGMPGAAELSDIPSEDAAAAQDQSAAPSSATPWIIGAVALLVLVLAVKGL